MKTSDFGSPRKGSSRIPSISSSKVKLSVISRTRKIGCERNVASVLLQQRHALRIIHDDVDVTPKPLIHPDFNMIDENQITALETIGSFQTISSSQIVASTSRISDFKSTSSIFKISPMASEDLMESLLAIQMHEVLEPEEEEDIAPLPFYLSSEDSAIFATRPESVTITLKETQTFFIFEMPQLTEDLQTPEGKVLQRENEDYEYVTVGPGSSRKLLDAETQTICILTKSRGTHLGLRPRQNEGMFANKWVLYDILAAPELMTEKDEYLIVHSKESMERMQEAQELVDKLPLPKATDPSIEEQLFHISQLDRFRHAARMVERIIASNVFATMQKRFTGLDKRDPYDLDLKFDYRLDLLWMHKHEMARDRPVTAFQWNPDNSTILAVAYGAQTGSDKANGLLLIWSAKIPSQPSRNYSFDSPLSAIGWSTERPNLLAIGFYDGSIKIITVNTMNLSIVRETRRETSPTFFPHWQVQWWSGDEQFDYQEQIYTSDQEGRVYCYRYTEDFFASEIMRLYRMEGKLSGVARTDHCVAHDVLISRQPAALVLQKHPIISNIYFVGSDEGCIYRCSMNYLHQHIDSFVAHDGPIYCLEFSPFCQKLFLTCGADWCIRIWVDGITEPLITLFTEMACVRNACWSPTYSTIIASVVNDQICIWDIRRRTHIPMSVTVAQNGVRLIAISFTINGNQLVAGDIEGTIYIYNLEGMPFPPYDPTKMFIESIQKALITKPELLRKLKKLGPPF